MACPTYLYKITLLFFDFLAAWACQISKIHKEFTKLRFLNPQFSFFVHFLYFSADCFASNRKIRSKIRPVITGRPLRKKMPAPCYRYGRSFRSFPDLCLLTEPNPVLPPICVKETQI